MQKHKLIYEYSKKGRIGVVLPKNDVEDIDLEQVLPKKLIRNEGPDLPNVSEAQMVRHYVNLSQSIFSVDTNFYPLGSCTMKYNPKINEKVSSLPGFTRVHPLQSEETTQGILEILYEFQNMLKNISGLDDVTLQPAAGAHGEFTGLLVIKQYMKAKGLDKDVVLIPDSAHGTNPASCTLCGFKIKQVNSNKYGRIDLDDLKKKLDDNVAAMMITNPNTLGLFETDIKTISDLLHEKGAFLYMDGANLNALVARSRPGDFGVDVMHFNLHKTFSTPHGGGGPGSGPIGVKQTLSPYLPIPRLIKTEQGFRWDYDRVESIGKIKSFFGNILVIIRAYAYIRMLGSEGLKRVSGHSVLNANYLLALVKKAYKLPYTTQPMHEFVLSGSKQKRNFGVRTLDIAKRLLDYGFHPPTVYFPLIVHEAIMIEPTETEDIETLEEFANTLLNIADECEKEPEMVKNAPYNTLVKRVNEVKAAKEPVLKYKNPTKDKT